MIEIARTAKIRNTTSSRFHRLAAQAMGAWQGELHQLNYRTIQIGPKCVPPTYAAGAA
jgi:hypothetical protein